MSLLFIIPSGTQSNNVKMENKKKRGSNFTQAEKNTLLKLIYKYRQIIEDKGTNATITLKKRETWDKVARQYNAINNSSGPRTWQQLRHLYENIKQRTKRKNIKDNGSESCPKDLQTIKEEPTNDKTETNEMDVCAYESESVLPETTAQVSPVVTPQVEPLQKTYNDAAFYFVDTKSLAPAVQHIPPVQDVPVEKVEVDVDIDEEYMPFNTVDAASSTSSEYDGQKSPLLVDDETSGTNSLLMPITQNKVTQKKSNPNQQTNKKISVKEQYFRTKLKNAQLENKYLLSKHKMEVSKYKLEIEILKLRLKKLQCQ